MIPQHQQFIHQTHGFSNSQQSSWYFPSDLPSYSTAPNPSFKHAPRRGWPEHGFDKTLSQLPTKTWLAKNVEISTVQTMYLPGSQGHYTQPWSWDQQINKTVQVWTALSDELVFGRYMGPPFMSAKCEETLQKKVLPLLTNFIYIWWNYYTVIPKPKLRRLFWGESIYPKQLFVIRYCYERNPKIIWGCHSLKDLS